MAGVKPGPSTVAGLKWLARVGPTPLGAWGIAMGWGQAAVYSHARRLRTESCLAMCSRTRGEGSLVYASRMGVRDAGVTAAAVERRPAAVTWPHCEACAWTAAWLTARGRGMVGPRELLARTDWRGELRWRERVLADGAQAGLSVDRGTMRIELIATIQREAVARHRARRRP